MEPRRQQQIEQIEIIERTVHESTRPITTSEALAFQPQSTVRKSSEHFITTAGGAGGGSAFDPERRFQLTSERDAGHDPSLLYSPLAAAGIGHQTSSSSFLRDPPLHRSTPERSASINQFGYDVHEVKTNGVGARIVETHAAGHSILDRSLAETNAGGGKQQRTPPSFERSPQSILKQPAGAPLAVQESAETSWRKSPSDNSVHRKDSYRRMQDEQAANGVDQLQNTSFYGQSSNATILSKQSKPQGLSWSGNLFSGAGRHRVEGSFDRLKSSIAEMSRQMREGEWSPRLIGTLLLLGLLILLLILLLWFIVSAIFVSRSTYAFWLYPPVCEECAKKAGSSYSPPSKLYVHLYSPAQAYFELIGNPPFKSNSFTAVDFETGYVAIADHALTDSQGKHTTCFLMKLDRTALPDMSILVDALKETYEEVHAQFGWQEYWQFNVEPVDQSFVVGKFRDRIEDCQNVQWYLLKHSVYTKDESCSYCYDFCLPDYAVLRRQKYEDEVSLGVRRLNCFRLYVPEWSKFQLQTDSSGGHFGYPLHQPQNTQRDASGNWANWQQSSTTFNQQQRRRRSQSTAAAERIFIKDKHKSHLFI